MASGTAGLPDAAAPAGDGCWCRCRSATDLATGADLALTLVRDAALTMTCHCMEETSLALRKQDVHNSIL